jgi:hypothetical protein
MQPFRLNERGQERARALLRLYIQRAAGYAGEGSAHPWRCSWTVSDERIEADGLLAQDARDCLMRLLAIVEDPRAQANHAAHLRLSATPVTALAASA